jgi:hypothetical protein
LPQYALTTLASGSVMINYSCFVDRIVDFIKGNIRNDVDLVTYSVISHERGKNREVFATNGTYPWSFVTKIFLSGQPSHGGDRKTFE